MRKLLAVASMVVSGCASITASRSEPFSVLSEPPGAEVRLNGSIVGTTPTQVDIPRQMNSPLIEVTRRGFSTEACHVTHSAGGGFVAADVAMCLFLFPIGCIALIDANGSWNSLDVDWCRVSLKPTQSTVTSVGLQ
jgi:hypothetical protein